MPASNRESRAALLASVETLSISEELRERWREAAQNDARLNLPTFFVRCADMGYACLPTLLRRAFAERDVAFEDLRFAYLTLGAQHADALGMTFAEEELASMTLDERLAATEYSLENFLDIYRFMPAMQAQKGAELDRIAAEAAAAAQAALAALAAPEQGGAGREEALRSLSSHAFVQKLASSREA